MRTTRRRTIGLAFGLALATFVVIAPVVSAKPGSQIGLHPHVTSREYDQPFHRIQGRVGVVNDSDRKASLTCTVVVLLKGSDDVHKRGRDQFDIRVDAGKTRKPHFNVTIRDEDHHLENVPTSVAAHCHQG